MNIVSIGIHAIPDGTDTAEKKGKEEGEKGGKATPTRAPQGTTGKRHRERRSSAARDQATREGGTSLSEGKIKKKNQLKGEGREKKGKEKEEEEEEEEEEKLRQRNWDRQGKESRGGTERQQR